MVSNSLLQIGATGLVTTKQTAAGLDGAYIYLYSGEIAINRGTIDSSGSSNSTALPAGPLATVAPAATNINGGAGGGVDFEAGTYLYNTGAIWAKGGASTYGTGGKGRHIHVFAYNSDLNNSGAIDNSGGNGGYRGGDGGYNIRLYGGGSSDFGDVGGGNLIVTGSVLSNGGNGGTGNGGYGGEIYFDNYGGKIWSNATINIKGGSSTAANGGAGGGFKLDGDYHDGEPPVENNGIKLGGTIDLSGGSGATGGGQGGELYFNNGASGNGLLPSPAVEMVGFASLQMDGGSGVIGGNGGGMEIYTGVYEIDDIFGSNPTAPVIALILNQVPVYARGGAGNTQGGDGGWFLLSSVSMLTGDAIVSTSFTTTNLAAIDVAGGTGETGGLGGNAFLLGYGTVVNTGSINAKGGVGTITGGNGGGYGTGVFPFGGAINAKGGVSPTGGAPPIGVFLWSKFDIENTGAIDASGGKGGDNGGYGGTVEMLCEGQVRTNAVINAVGGAGALGGDGGFIDLSSYSWITRLVHTEFNPAQLFVTGGAVGGVDGEIAIDDFGP